MGDLTRTFGGLIIMAHRVNSQSLYVIPFIHIYILDIIVPYMSLYYYTHEIRTNNCKYE